MISAEAIKFVNLNNSIVAIIDVIILLCLMYRTVGQDFKMKLLFTLCLVAFSETPIKYIIQHFEGAPVTMSSQLVVLTVDMIFNLAFSAGLSLYLIRFLEYRRVILTYRAKLWIWSTYGIMILCTYVYLYYITIVQKPFSQSVGAVAMYPVIAWELCMLLIIFLKREQVGKEAVISWTIFFIVPMIFDSALRLFPGLHTDVPTLIMGLCILYIGVQTQENSVQNQLKKALDQAKMASESKTTFLFNMSHDIRTPMNAIIGYSELLSKHLDEPEVEKEYIEKIQTSGKYLLDLINGVLEMARIESGKVALQESLWSAKAFNDSLEDAFYNDMLKKNITMERTIDIIHDDLFLDGIKLHEVFLNVLSNSIKYTPVGGHIKMELKELPAGNPKFAYYRSIIEDNGIGMSKDFLPHIFDSFSRERNSTESKVIGTGLGMGIVKKYVDLMQGTIEVESELDKGTKITITIPHRLANEEDIRAAIKEKTTEELDFSIFKDKRILLAEDNDINAEIAIEILTAAGFQVERAADGNICVDMIDSANPSYYDLILMDIQMPNMNGYEATAAIRKMPSHKKSSIPIIAMTANAFEEDKKNAIEVGMNDHIAKPIDTSKLFNTLREYIK